MESLLDWIETSCADDVESMERILARNPHWDIDTFHPTYERTALMLAAGWNAADAIDFLLRYSEARVKQRTELIVQPY